MMKSKKRFMVLLMAVSTLMVAGAAGFAQRHLMLAKATRPEVKIELSAAVERDSALVPLDKATAVKGADFDTSQLELSEWKSAKLDNDAALVTYLVTPKDPKMSQERHTTIWANRSGKWVALLHIGTPVMKPMTPSEMKKM